MNEHLDSIDILTRELDRRDRHVRRQNRWMILLVALLLVSGVFSYQSSRNAITAARATQTLLTTGKTTSAINSQKTEKLAEEIKALIEDGKTSGAQESARAAAASAEGLVLLHQAESLIGSEIAANRAAGAQHEEVLCSVAAALHDTASVVAKYCPS